jgi:hypothetical protein
MLLSIAPAITAFSGLAANSKVLYRYDSTRHFTRQDIFCEENVKKALDIGIIPRFTIGDKVKTALRINNF